MIGREGRRWRCAELAGCGACGGGDVGEAAEEGVQRSQAGPVPGRGCACMPGTASRTWW